jgi:flagellar hook-associated protein 2
MANSSIMSSLSSAGLGTGAGLDVAGTVSQLIAAIRAPEQVWTTQQSLAKVQGQSLTQLNTEVTALSNAIDSLKDVAGAVTARAATSSNTNLVSAAASNATPVGSHTVVVSSLATSSSYYSDPIATSSTTLAAGTFTIKVGSAAATTITVDATNNTLDKLATSINNQNLGVTASVITDANGSRLAVVSNTSGAAGDITITNEAGGLTFNKGVTGQNASLTVDGVPISSASNTVSGVVPGLALNLAGADPNTAVQVTITPDTSKTKQAITDFVTAFNTIVQDLSSQFTYNTTTNSAGPLAGDSVARMVQEEMLNGATYSMTGTNGFNSLSSLGITMNNDGTLGINDATLTNALNSNFADVQNFFQSANGTGFATFLSAQIDPLTDSTQGAFFVDLQGIQATQKSLQDQIDSFEVYVASQQVMLTAQYNQVNVLLQQLPLIQKQTESQLSGLVNLNKSNQ